MLLLRILLSLQLPVYPCFCWCFFSSQDITEIKSFPQPPPAVRVVMEAVCTLLDEPTDWENAKRVIGSATFINSLVKFDKDNIPDRILKKLAKCVAYFQAPVRDSSVSWLS